MRSAFRPARPTWCLAATSSCPGAKKVLAAVREGHTIFVANTAEIMPGDFTRSADFSLPVERLKKAIREAAGDDQAHFFDATRTASALFGNSLGANMFMLGFAFQHGGLPLSAEAVEKAIELNGEAVAMNVAAFRWGRRAAHQPDFVRALVVQPGTAAQSTAVAANARRRHRPPRRVPDRLSERRLCASATPTALAELRKAEASAAPGSTAVTEAAARNLFKLMAIKDEYEVARLYTDGSFERQLAQAVPELTTGWNSISRRRSWPARHGRQAEEVELRSLDDEGIPAAGSDERLARHGRSMCSATAPKRRMERRLLAQYEADLELVASALAPGKIEAAAALASVPALIRGYGHVKQASAERAAGERLRLLDRLAKTPARPELQAAE